MRTTFCFTCGNDLTKYSHMEIKTCPHCYCQLKNKKDASMPSGWIATGVAAIFSFGVLLSWGQYAGQALPAHAKHLVGIATGADYARLAEVCTLMKDASCVAKMLSLKIQKDPGSIEALAELGRVQFMIGRYEESLQTLARYNAAGGTDINARFRYAQALARTGRQEQALQTYKQLLDSRPDSVMYPIAEEYVNLLVQNGRRAEAARTILRTRQKSFGASNFMDNKYRQIASVMNERLPASQKARQSRTFVR